MPTAPALGQLRRAARLTAALATLSPGGATATEKVYNNVMPSRASPLVLLFCP